MGKMVPCPLSLTCVARSATSCSLAFMRRYVLLTGEYQLRLTHKSHRFRSSCPPIRRQGSVTRYSLSAIHGIRRPDIRRGLLPTLLFFLIPGNSHGKILALGQRLP